jgi:hypothetical protein
MKSARPTDTTADRVSQADEVRVACCMLNAEADARMLGIEETGLPLLNDSEAGNLSFILSDGFSRNGSWHIMLDMGASEPHMAEIANKVSRRLAELSLRLGDDYANSRLDEPA